MARNLRVGIQRGLRKSIGGGFGTGDVFTLSPASFDFSRTKTKDSRIAFTRASSGTFVDADGLIKSSVVNILPYSEQMNAWVVGGGSSVTANQAVAPNGTNTAERVQHGSGGSSWIRQDILTAGTTYTASVYAKAVTPGTSDQFTFDLGGLSSVFTATNEWQRFTFTGTASNASFYLNNGDDSFSTDVYFWGAQVEEGSAATDYIPTTNTIYGAPRFDHDLATGESLGLLIEEARTNLATYSERLNEWTAGSNTTRVTNAATAPDGTNTADRLVFPQNNRTYVQTSNAFLTSGTTYTASVYVKAVTPGTNDQFTFSFGGQGSFNATSRFTATGEWQRFTATMTPTLTGGAGSFIINNEGDQFRSDIYVWGVQVEEASFATSYIPTLASQVTRAADVVEITGTDFSSFYNQSEGTVFAEYNVLGDKTGFSQFIYDFSDGTNNNAIRQFKRSNNNETVSTARTNGNIQGRIEGNTNTPFNERYKTAYALDGTDAQRAIKGIASSEFGVSMPTVDRLRLGGRQDNTFLANCHISRFAYFPTRLTGALLQSITS